MGDYPTTLALMLLTIGVMFLQYQNSFLSRDLYGEGDDRHRLHAALCGVLCAVAVMAVCAVELCSRWL